MVSFAGAAELAPNELGRVMILEYHKIDYPEERWTRTPENFRRDLETFYAKGYRLINLGDLLDRRIALPAGTTPVVLTFDDSSPGQFRYIEANGSVQIDPKSAVGILEAFIAEKPDFGRGGTFYAKGYRLINLGDLLDRRIALPAGTTPVVLTFDDSSPGQFRYIEAKGSVQIDPKSAVGILEAFIAEKPDFGRGGTFYVLPGASKPNRLFNQPEFEGRKLQYLVSHGYEIGNHTLWHANLAKYPEATVRAQVAEAQVWIQRHVPDYRTRTLALPHGAYPADISWVLRGSAKGMSYSHDAVLMVAGGAAPSPFSRAFDPARLPRIQAVERDLAFWLNYFDKNPGERFVSDGDASAVTVPTARRDRVRDEFPRPLRVVERKP